MISPGVAEALEALAEGRVVAVPTDTVYGLAARVDRPGALSAVFALKGRPPDVALPVLVDGVEQVDRVALAWRPHAAALAARFWPGPLTVVVAARPEVGPLLGGDGVTVGVRHPAHAVTEALCREAGPLAVTSANPHGQPPCTTAAAVAEAFAVPPGDAPAGALALVLDGGTCAGVPSTVVDCTTAVPGCLRDGGVPWSAVLAHAGLDGRW